MYAGRAVSGSALFSWRAAGVLDDRCSSPGWRETSRIGARAFLTLRGYVGRKRRNGVGFSSAPGKTLGHRPGSRLRWDEGRREAATMGLLCVLARVHSLVQKTRTPGRVVRLSGVDLVAVTGK